MDCIGDDDNGALYRRGLESEGVDTSQLKIRRGHPTSACLVFLTPKGTHGYVGFEGASELLKVADLDEGYLASSRSFFGSGYSLVKEPIREAAGKAMRVASNAGARVFFDTSPYADKIPKESLLGAIALTDVLILNEREMRLTAHSLGVPEDPDSLLRLGPAQVVLKRGADGCSVYLSSGAEHFSGFSVEVVDTTGAGDSFDAAFVYGTMQGWPLRETAIMANAVGAVKVTKLAAGKNVPTIDEIKRFLNKRGIDLTES